MNLTVEQESEIKKLVDEACYRIHGAKTLDAAVEPVIRRAVALGQSFNAEPIQLLREALEIAPKPNRDALMLMWHQKAEGYLETIKV